MRGPLLVVDVERLLRSKETGGRTRRTVGGFGIAHVARISSTRGRLRTTSRPLVMVMSLVLALIASAITRTRRLLLMSNSKNDRNFVWIIFIGIAEAFTVLRSSLKFVRPSFSFN